MNMRYDFPQMRIILEKSRLLSQRKFSYNFNNHFHESFFIVFGLFKISLKKIYFLVDSLQTCPAFEYMLFFMGLVNSGFERW
jgi:hypothetical protein